MVATNVADVSKEKTLLRTVWFRSQIGQASTWQRQLIEFLPSDFQLQPWASEARASEVWVSNALASDERTASINNGSHQPTRYPTPPSLLLFLTDLTDPETMSPVQTEEGDLPVVHAGPTGSQFQIGPGVISGQTACPACLQRQGMLFPGIYTTAVRDAAVPLSTNLIARLAARLATELVAFARSEADSSLRRGYLLRQPGAEETWQAYRALRDPYCEHCSLYAQYPSEAIYIK